MDRLAARAASAGRKGSGSGKICRASASAVASIGPHKNSAHAMLLTLNASCADAQAANCVCAGEPATVKNQENFLWTTFTRSNPATDIEGIEPFESGRHWGCRGSLVIDARRKPHHAPPLVEDPAVTRCVEALAAPGGPLDGII